VTSRREWSDVKEDFTCLVFKAGVDSIAGRTHVHRSTIYRLINGATRRPSGPLRAEIEKVVANATRSERIIAGEDDHNH